nr:MAG TPA: hypothetical protein [Crassvirales sp.]
MSLIAVSTDSLAFSSPFSAFCISSLVKPPSLRNSL